MRPGTVLARLQLTPTAGLDETEQSWSSLRGPIARSTPSPFCARVSRRPRRDPAEPTLRPMAGWYRAGRHRRFKSGLQPATSRFSDSCMKRSSLRGKPCNRAGSAMGRMGTRCPHIACGCRPDEEPTGVCVLVRTPDDGASRDRISEKARVTATRRPTLAARPERTSAEGGLRRSLA
jgi:hypothetical protein